MITKLVLVALLRSVMLVDDSEATIAYCDDAIATPVRKVQHVDDPIALPVRKAVIDIQAWPVRKKASQIAPAEKVIATIYSASSFRCPACESLEDFVRANRKMACVAFNKSEPSWVKAYPTVVYRDGHSPDNGQHLKSIIN